MLISLQLLQLHFPILLLYNHTLQTPFLNKTLHNTEKQRNNYTNHYQPRNHYMGVKLFSVKTVAASATLLSSALALRLATPAVTKFLTSETPRIYESLSSWLTPPYLYFVINGIIISIAATSRFQKPIAADTPLSPPLETTSDYDKVAGDDGNLQPEFVAEEVVGDEVTQVCMVESIGREEEEEGFVLSRSSWSPRRIGLSEGLLEKPPVVSSNRRRRSMKASPEGGKPLGVTRPKKHETLESTWRTITDGRPVPLARHLKKSDTWETHARAATNDPSPAMLKSETFAAGSVAEPEVVSPATGKLRREISGGKLRREPSLGQDDLNRRVEAFIKKFNEEMRLQRQNSVQQYLDMINGSAVK